MIFCIIIGYIFDLIGRKITLTTSIVLQCTALFLMPYMAPNVFPGVYLLRILYFVATMGTVCSPLINDYVKRGSRGRAGALNSFGLQMGDFLNQIILLNLIQGYPIGT